MNLCGFHEIKPHLTKLFVCSCAIRLQTQNFHLPPTMTRSVDIGLVLSVAVPFAVGFALIAPSAGETRYGTLAHQIRHWLKLESREKGFIRDVAVIPAQTFFVELCRGCGNVQNVEQAKYVDDGNLLGCAHSPWKSNN